LSAKNEEAADVELARVVVGREATDPTEVGVVVADGEVDVADLLASPPTPIDPFEPPADATPAPSMRTARPETTARFFFMAASVPGRARLSSLPANG
jgi:hypothetical protein